MAFNSVRATPDKKPVPVGDLPQEVDGDDPDAATIRGKYVRDVFVPDDPAWDLPEDESEGRAGEEKVPVWVQESLRVFLILAGLAGAIGLIAWLWRLSNMQPGE